MDKVTQLKLGLALSASLLFSGCAANGSSSVEYKPAPTNTAHVTNSVFDQIDGTAAKYPDAPTSVQQVNGTKVEGRWLDRGHCMTYNTQACRDFEAYNKTLPHNQQIQRHEVKVLPCDTPGKWMDFNHDGQPDALCQTKGAMHEYARRGYITGQHVGGWINLDWIKNGVKFSILRQMQIDSQGSYRDSGIHIGFDSRSKNNVVREILADRGLECFNMLTLMNVNQERSLGDKPTDYTTHKACESGQRWGNTLKQWMRHGTRIKIN